MFSFCANSTSPESLAEFLTRHIDACEKTQAEIAAEVGFPHSNIISMIKKGNTKVPVARVPGFASALDLCEHDLLRRVLAEDHQELLAILDRLSAAACNRSNSTNVGAP